MPYEAEIRTFGDGVDAAINPGSIVVKHHRAGVAEVRVERLTGGHLLHLALAGCVFNNVRRMACHRGITVHDASVRLQGEFTAEGDSTGIQCTVNISSDADVDHVPARVRDAFDDSTVGSVLKRATKVERIEA